MKIKLASFLVLSTALLGNENELLEQQNLKRDENGNIIRKIDESLIIKEIITNPNYEDLVEKSLPNIETKNTIIYNGKNAEKRISPSINTEDVIRSILESNPVIDYIPESTEDKLELEKDEGTENIILVDSDNEITEDNKDNNKDDDPEDSVPIGSDNEDSSKGETIENNSSIDNNYELTIDAKDNDKKERINLNNIVGENIFKNIDKKSHLELTIEKSYKTKNDDEMYLAIESLKSKDPENVNLINYVYLYVRLAEENKSYENIEKYVYDLFVEYRIKGEKRHDVIMIYIEFLENEEKYEEEFDLLEGLALDEEKYELILGKKYMKFYIKTDKAIAFLKYLYDKTNDDEIKKYLDRI